VSGLPQFGLLQCEVFGYLIYSGDQYILEILGRYEMIKCL